MTEILKTYVLPNGGTMSFPGIDEMILQPGIYYPVAFGVVRDVGRATFIAHELARWKLDPPPRTTQ